MAKEGIKGSNAAESTARHLEDLILEGSLRPGEPLLPEREMALRLNVSRPTLRQGMKLLEDKGLLVADAGGARVVAPLATSITDPLIELLATRGEVVDDYLELRGTLEGMAASLAATRANDVMTSSPGVPGGTALPVSGSMTSGQHTVSSRCRPPGASMHSKPSGPVSVMPL